MKKVFSFISVLTLFFLVSCSNKKEGGGGMSEKAKKNLELVQSFTKVFESGDFSKIADYFTPDVVDHAGMNGKVVGIDSLKAQFAMIMDMVKDMKNEPILEIANDDYTIQWMKQTSTMKVDAMGFKAGSTNVWSAIEVSKFKDGKISEHWSFLDWADMMKMMGAASSQVPAPDTTTEPVKDSTSK